MPEDGLCLTQHQEILTFDEITRICRIMAGMGLKKIKLTGGEPLVRKNLAQLVAQLREIDGIEKITLTTNGVLLAQQIDGLCAAGLDAVNISLDTPDRDFFRQITRRDEIAHVFEGLDAVMAHPEISCKINCVPLGVPQQKIMDLLEIARTKPVHVRFIEMMPIGLGKEYKGQSEEELLSEIEKTYGPVSYYKGKLGNGPCHYYSIRGFEGKVGFISAVSHKFCKNCNRVRLTSQGYLKTCLQYEAGGELKPLLRNGADDETIRRMIASLVDQKPKAHSFYMYQIENENRLCMSQIGG
jgi:cyclic pyranopterin phosphate synthase